MTTEQMDWLDDERAGRHAADKLVPKRPAKDDGRGRWPFTPNPADSVKPDPMGGASLADRLRAMGAIRTKHQSGETVEWVNAPLAVVVDQAKLAAPALSEGHDENTLGKVHAALLEAGITGVRKRTDLISEMQNAGILFRERVTELEPEPYWVQRDAVDGDHTHYTREARDQCAAGDHQYAKLLDDAAEREKIAATIDAKQGEASMIAAAGWCMPSSQVYNFLPTDEEIKMAKRERRKAKKARRRAEKLEAQVTTMAEEPIENRLRRAWLNGFKDGVDRASYAATESTGRWDY